MFSKNHVIWKLFNYISYASQQLATKYDTDPEIKAILDFADWVIAPVSNPDGYEYTWTTVGCCFIIIFVFYS